jgi:hypothetical protein
MKYSGEIQQETEKERTKETQVVVIDQPQLQILDLINTQN